MKQIIDTNVLLVANGMHGDVSSECISACVRKLAEIKNNGVVVLDDAYRILKEYLLKTSPNQPKGVGDVFLKWLQQNLANNTCVETVAITENLPDEFDEFPDAGLQQMFDPPDRKFVAVANAHDEKPPILQAADCKWLDWWQVLANNEIEVKFLCPNDVCRFYQNKFPRKPLPPLPSD